MRLSVFAAALGLLSGCGLGRTGLGPDGDGPDAGLMTGPDAAQRTDAGEAPESADDGPLPDSALPSIDATEEATEAGPVSPDDSGPDAPGITAGHALQFAAGAYVDMGAVPIPTDFTIEAWVRPASSSTNETDLVAEDRNGQGAGQLRLGLDAGKPFFIMSDATGNTHGLFGTSYALEAAQALPVGTWSHLAVTKSGAAFALFVGPSQAAAFTANAAFGYGGPPVRLRVAARVAADGTSADSAFAGAIDEVRFWSVPRPAAQIAANMSTTVATDSTLLSCWRFDEGAGLSASDEAGRYPGTLVAGPQWIVSTAF